MVTIGRVTFDAGIDGKALPAQAKKLAREASSQFGKSFKGGLAPLGRELADELGDDGFLVGDRFGETVQKSVAGHLTKLRQDMADAFVSQDGFDRFAKSVGGADAALARMRTELGNMQDSGEANDKMVGDLSNSLDGLHANLRRVEQESATLSARNEELDKSLRLVRKTLGSGRSFDEYARSMGGADSATRSLRTRISELSESGRLGTDDVNQLNGRIREFTVGARDAEAAATRLRIRNAQLSEALREVRGALGSEESFRRYVTYVGDAGTATDRLRGHLVRLGNDGRLGGFEIDRLTGRMGEYRDELGRSELVTNRVGEALGRFRSQLFGAIPGLKRFADENDRVHTSLRNSWRSMDDNVRQIILITAAILAGGTQIAALGSLAGNAIVGLAGAVAGLAVGLGVAIAGFKGMLGPLEDIAPAARASAEQLQSIRAAFADIRQNIQAQLFSGLEGPLERMGSVLIPALNAGLGQIAAAIQPVIAGFINALTSMDGLDVVAGMLWNISLMMKPLGDVIGTFAAAFGKLFNASAPGMTAFIQGLADIGARFNEWAGSQAARDAIEQFFANGSALAGPFMNLLGQTADMLSNLITPEVISMSQDFLNNLAAFMPALGTLLDGLGALDIFGLIAELLNELGQALAPLAAPFKELMGLVNDLVQAFFPLLAPIGEVASALLDSLMPGVEAIVSAIQDWIPLLDPLWSALEFLAETVGGALSGALEDLLPKLTPVIEALAEGLGGAIEELAPIIPDLIDTLLRLVDPFVDLALALAPLIEQLLPIFAENITETVNAMTPLIDQFTDFVEKHMPDIIDAIEDATPFIVLFAKVMGTVGLIMTNIVVAIVGFLIWLANLRTDIALSLDEIVGFFSGLVDAAGRAFGGFIFAVSEWFNDLLQTIITWASEVYTNVVNTVNQIIDGWEVLVEGIKMWFDQIYQNIVDWAVEVVVGFLVWAQQIIDGWAIIVEGIRLWFDQIWNNIVAWATQVVSGIIIWVQQIIDGWGLIVAGVQAWFDQVYANIVAWAVTVISGIITWVNQIIANWGLIVGGIQAWFQTVYANIVAWALGVIGNFIGWINQIVAGWGVIVSGIQAWFNQVYANIVAWIASVLAAAVNIGKDIAAFFAPMVDGISGFIDDVVANIESFIQTIKDIVGGIGDFISNALSFNVSLPSLPGIPANASGTVYSRATLNVAGEAGPEAIVPLNRPLSQVDPAVRELSRFAQGMGGGETVVGGRSLVIAEGAIQVITPTSDPGLVASMVLDGIADDIDGND